MHRVVVDLLWLVAGVYIALVLLRETSLISAEHAPAFTRAIEFAIGTGGRGGGTAA